MPDGLYSFAENQAASVKGKNIKLSHYRPELA
jgi:hypothetical protein